jgi:hypothetical protein
MNNGSNTEKSKGKRENKRIDEELGLLSLFSPVL